MAVSDLEVDRDVGLFGVAHCRRTRQPRSRLKSGALPEVDFFPDGIDRANAMVIPTKRRDKEMKTWPGPGCPGSWSHGSRHRSPSETRQRPQHTLSTDPRVVHREREATLASSKCLSEAAKHHVDETPAGKPPAGAVTSSRDRRRFALPPSLGTVVGIVRRVPELQGCSTSD